MDISLRILIYPQRKSPRRTCNKITKSIKKFCDSILRSFVEVDQWFKENISSDGYFFAHTDLLQRKNPRTCNKITKSIKKFCDSILRSFVEVDQWFKENISSDGYFF